MANNSSIEWTDATWNPLAGCTRASAGCDNCYAAKMSLRLEAMALADIEAGKDPGGKRKYIGIAVKNGRGVPVFNGTINLDEVELQRPYSWKKPRRVFVNSMSDLFHKDVPTKFIVDAFKVMRDNPQHIFQVLTKRPERAAALWPPLLHQIGGEWPANVWIGTSVENQETADLRIPELLKVPAAVRFLSMEPLLGPLDLTRINTYLWRGAEYVNALTGDLYGIFGVKVGNAQGKIGWGIVGGESGPNARPMHPDWVRSLRDQCVAAGVSYFFKQWGRWIARNQWIKSGRVLADVPDKAYVNGKPIEGDQVYAVGKHVAGRLLDGRTWDEFPR